MSKKRTKSEFHRLREAVGLARQDDAKKFLEISLRTLQRWDKEGAPPWAMRLLRYMDRWDCAAHGPEWTGWRFSRGRLVNAKEKLIFTPERLRLWRGMCERLDRLETEAENRRCPIRPLWGPLARYVKTIRLYVKN